jgi:hypothetical protein
MERRTPGSAQGVGAGVGRGFTREDVRGGETGQRVV